MKVLTQTKELVALASGEKIDHELIVELFTKSNLEEFKGDYSYSAFQAFKFICENLKKKKEYDAIRKIYLHACELFANEWDIEAIQFILEHLTEYGEPTSAVKNVMLEYEEYKAEAITLVDDSRVKEAKEKVISADVKVTLARNGRLSIWRKGKEHVIYFGEGWI